ncbi:MAG: ferredoxin [Myxococcota bacterium]
MFDRLRNKLHAVKEGVKDIKQRIDQPPAGARPSAPPAPPSRPSMAPSAPAGSAPAGSLAAAARAAAVPSAPPATEAKKQRSAEEIQALLEQTKAAVAKQKAEGRLLHADTGSTDIAAYVARAKANGRDPATVKGGEGRNVDEDGTPYWGPVRNDSSVAKAEGKVLTIDQWECISCGTCVEQTDKVFFLPSTTDAKANPIAQDGPMDLIQDAIDACPVTCIAWVAPDEAEDRGLATGDEPGSPRPEG